MTSFQPQNGEIYNLKDLYNNKVPGFTHYKKIKDKPSFIDLSEVPKHYYTFKQNNLQKHIGVSRPISEDSRFIYEDGHYIPLYINTSINDRREITENIQGTKYYQTFSTDGRITENRYLSQYDRNSRQFRPIIVTDETGSRYGVLPSSELLQDGSNHFSHLDLLSVNDDNIEKYPESLTTFIRQDDGSYIKESSPSDDESDAIQHYDFNPETNQLTKSKPNPLEPYEMIDVYVDQKLPPKSTEFTSMQSPPDESEQDIRSMRNIELRNLSSPIDQTIPIEDENLARI